MLQLTLNQAAALMWAAGVAQGICALRILESDPPSRLVQTLSFAGIIALIPVPEVLERFGQVAP